MLLVSLFDILFRLLGASSGFPVYRAAEIASTVARDREWRTVAHRAPQLTAPHIDAACTIVTISCLDARVKPSAAYAIRVGDPSLATS